LPQSFHRKREVATSIRAIAVAEIDRALAAIRAGDADEAEIIHTVRQQLKRLRALIRLPLRCSPEPQQPPKDIPPTDVDAIVVHFQRAQRLRPPSPAGGAGRAIPCAPPRSTAPSAARAARFNI